MLKNHLKCFLDKRSIKHTFKENNYTKNTIFYQTYLKLINLIDITIKLNFLIIINFFMTKKAS